MQVHEMDVVIPENHQLMIRFPETIRSGPARLVVMVPADQATEGTPEPASPEALARWAALKEDLAADPRPFQELSVEERRARLQRVMGAGRGLFSTSEEFARRKREEIEIEERKFAR